MRYTCQYSRSNSYAPHPVLSLWLLSFFLCRVTSSIILKSFSLLSRVGARRRLQGLGLTALAGFNRGSSAVLNPASYQFVSYWTWINDISKKPRRPPLSTLGGKRKGKKTWLTVQDRTGFRLSYELPRDINSRDVQAWFRFSMRTKATWFWQCYPCFRRKDGRYRNWSMLDRRCTRW